MGSKPAYQTVTILNGAALSNAVNLTLVGGPLVGVQMPAAWTAANLTFQVSHDGTTYQDFYTSAGAEIVLTAAAARFIAIDPANYFGVRFVRLRSGTAGVPVNQDADRLLPLVFLAE